MLVEQFLVDARTVVESLQVRPGNELQQVAVAGVVLGDDHQVIGGAFVGGAVAPAAVSDVQLASDDGFNAGILAFRVEIHHSVQGAVVGDAHGVHAQFAGATNQIGDAADAVEHTVFSMGMEMGEHVAVT